MGVEFRPARDGRRVCERCKCAFTVRPSQLGRFCSRECKDLAQWTRPQNDPRPCAWCGSVFTPDRHYGEARFCSKSCIGKALTTPDQMAAISRLSAERRGDALRDRGAGLSYRKRGGRHEHRAVAEQKLGRPLARGEVVHHIDGNPRNNDPDNLQVMTQAEHMRQHGLGIPGRPLPWAPWLRRGK